MMDDTRHPDAGLAALDASWMPDIDLTDDDGIPALHPSNDRRSVDERREQLIDAAVRILADEGLARATTRNITDTAGLALGAFHYAFTSKDELLAAVMERIVTETEAALLRALDEAGDASTVTRLLTGFWRFIDSHTELQLAKVELTVHALRDPSLRPLAEEQYERYAQAIARLLRRAPELAEDDDARHSMARYLVATLDGLVMQRLIEGDPDAARLRLAVHERALDHVVPTLADVDLQTDDECQERAAG